MKNLKVKIHGTFILCTLAFSSVFSQQEIQNSFYMFNSSVLNPAYAGSRDALSLVMDYRNQWTGWNGAPRTTNFIAHTPLKNESIGVGLNVVNDKIGPTDKNSIFADFAYRLKLNSKNDRLCFGIRGGVDMLRNNFTNLKINDGTDPLSSNNINFNSNTFNVGAGIYYYGKRHFLGFTAPKIIPSQISQDALFSASKQVPHFYFIGGYVYKINALWDLKPGFAVKYTKNAPLSADANISVLFNDKIWFGFMYRNGSAAGANVVYNISKQLRIGYAFDYTITKMSSYSPGTHEVILGFDLISPHKVFKSPRYF